MDLLDLFKDFNKILIELTEYMHDPNSPFDSDLCYVLDLCRDYWLKLFSLINVNDYADIDIKDIVWTDPWNDL